METVIEGQLKSTHYIAAYSHRQLICLIHPNLNIFSPLHFFQTYMSFFLRLNAEEDILKNVVNQVVDIDIHMKKSTMDVNGYRQLFNCETESKFWVNYPFKLQISFLSCKKIYFFIILCKTL